jgi:hypothetical protein
MKLEKRDGSGQSKCSWTFMSEHVRPASSSTRSAQDLLKIRVADISKRPLLMTIGEVNERITAHALIFKVETGQIPISWIEYQVFRPVPDDREGHRFQAHWGRIVEEMSNALSAYLFLLELRKTILEFFAST